MAAQSKHIIRKLFVDVLYESSADGLQLQKEVTEWCRNQLLPQLERMLERFGAEEEQVQVSAVEISLAMNEQGQWQDPALEKLSVQLQDKLDFQLHGADDLVSKTLARSFEEAFVFFLLKGYLPWWTDVESREQLLELLKNWIGNPNRTSSLMVQALQLESARKRLAYLLPGEQLFELLMVVYEGPVQADHAFLQQVAQLVTALAALKETALSFSIKQSLLQLLHRAPTDMRIAFIGLVRHLFQQKDWIAPSGAISPDMPRPLVASYFSLHGGQSQGLAVTFDGTGVPAIQTGNQHDPGKFTEQTSESSSRNVQDGRASHNEMEAENKLGTEKADLEGDKTSRIKSQQHPMNAEPSAALQATAEEETKQYTGEPGDIPSTAMERSSPEERSLLSMEQLSETEQYPAILSSSARPPENFDATQAESIEVINRHLRTITGIADEDDSIYIGNCGLMILAPFLPVFFKRMGLLEHEAINFYPKAILLLHYLATGSTVAAEHEVVLPKILCGLEPEQPVNLQQEWQNDWSMECRDLLLSVIEYWSILKDTSVDGLREAFLQRNGKLSRVEGDWLLQVEQQSYDMLLQQLPWNISMIKLGWMRRMIRTEWT